MKNSPTWHRFGTVLAIAGRKGAKSFYRYRYLTLILLVLALCLAPFTTQAAKDKKKAPPRLQPRGDAKVNTRNNAPAQPALGVSPQAPTRGPVAAARSASRDRLRTTPVRAVRPGNAAQGGSADQQIAGSGALEGQIAVGPIDSPLPDEAEVERRRLNHAQQQRGLPRPVPPQPQGQVFAVVPPPTDPPTPPPFNLPQLPQAPGDFVYRVVHDMTAGEVPTSERLVINEPSIASVGNTVFYTGNRYAARSTDGGQTFSYVDPYATFPSINNGFCCDQIVNYARNQNMVLWALQYNNSATTGTLRIARTIGAAGVASNTWVYYDFNPQTFGFASGNWMDFPNLTISASYLYATSNVFRTSNNAFTGSVIWRIPLTELAAGGAVNYDFLTRTDVGSLRCTENAGTTMYFGAWASNGQLRIHRWADGPGNIFWDNVTVNAFTFLSQDGVATSPDGTNWAARADSRIIGAWVANGIIGFMWNARQDGSFPYPYVIIGRFNEGTRALVTQNQVWHPSFAWLYGTAAVNSVGNLAGLLFYGGGSFYPRSAVWIVDDVQSSFAPIAAYNAAESNDGPNANVWGDYHTVRPHKSHPNTWVASTFYLNGGGSNTNTVPRYLWFGRERNFCTATALNQGQTLLPNLATSDCRSPARGDSRYADQFTFFGFAGQQVAISLASANFDAYLYLLDPSGHIIATDDDGGPAADRNSRIPANSGFFTLPATGTYTIEATSFLASETGSYRLTLSVPFGDVPFSHPFYSQINALAAAGVTAGCGSGNYCPGNNVTREQMAAFLIRALGQFSPPTPGSQRFGDVPPSNPFYAFIEQLALRQITLGCGGGNYCPGANVTREQMAAFIIRALHAPGYIPPTPGSQRFADVPLGNPFYAHIDEMAARGITLGCGGGNYCPSSLVSRDQMAAFLVRAFGL